MQEMCEREDVEHLMDRYGELVVCLIFRTWELDVMYVRISETCYEYLF